MGALTASLEYEGVSPKAEGEISKGSSQGAGLRLNGHAIIFSLATVLALATATECHSITHLPSLMYGAVLWLWWGCIASGMWKLGQLRPLASRFSTKSISLHVFLGSVLGVAHLLLLGSLGFTVAGWQQHATALSIWTSMLNVNRFGLEVLLYGFVFGITGIVQFQIRAQRDALKAAELQRQLSAAHLRALQMQLEPHFLFNTLNAITTLVELGRQKEAAGMLFHLNAILKGTLQRTTPDKVPLSQELEMMENYLAIEQVRFADRLRIEIKIEPAVLNGMVPSFLLQPIVENAIRHGVANCENEGLVEASAKREGARLLLNIRNSGRDISAPERNGHGIGLANTRERLAYFYNDQFTMKAEPVEPDGFEVTIHIPYERA